MIRTSPWNEVLETGSVARANEMLALGFPLLEIIQMAFPKPHPTRPEEVILIKAPGFIFGRTLDMPAFPAKHPHPAPKATHDGQPSVRDEG